MSFVSLRRAIAITALLVLLASPAAAVEPVDPWYVKVGNVAAAGFDVLLLRPLGFVTTAVGFTCFTVALPFSAINRDLGTPWELFVVEPADFTFRRPLGDF